MSTGNRIHRLLYAAGANIRNPSRSAIYRELKSTDFASSDELKAIQFQKLKEIVKFAATYSSFYAKQFRDLKFDHRSDLLEIEDIEKLPIISKSDLIQFNETIHTISKYKFRRLFFCETSGTSGEALTFFRDEYWDSANRASIQRGMSWFGVEPWERNGYFWGFNFSLGARVRVRIQDWLLNRYRLFTYKEDTVLTFLKKTRSASYIHGYSSMIYEVAKQANRNGIKLHNLRMVKGTSEKIHSKYQEEAIQAFGKKIISEYGAAESGIIAFECPEGKMHLNEETCIVEVDDHEIIVTNLVARSFPIIRYRLGDYVRLSPEACSCGRQHRILDEVTGRIGGRVVGKNDRTYPSLTFYYIFKNLALEKGIQVNYKAIQERVGELRLLLDRTLAPDEKKEVLNELQKYFNDSLDVTLEENAKLVDGRQKLKDFESLL